MIQMNSLIGLSTTACGNKPEKWEQRRKALERQLAAQQNQFRAAKARAARAERKIAALIEKIEECDR